MLRTSVLIIALLGACAHVPQPIVDFGQCVGSTISPQVSAILADVETALAGGSTEALVDLAKRIGWVTVDCAVSEVVNHTQKRLAAAPSDDLSKVTLETGQHWLKDHAGRSR